jgi:flagellar protein FliO/FliZ
MDFPFGSELPLAVRFFLAFIIVLVLIGATAFLVRRFGSSRIGGVTGRGRQPRLAVIDAAAVDGRRRLVLIRRDNVEHLLMIGGPSDVVVEANIVRGAAVPRDAAASRPAAAPADTLPRAVPLGESNMWPLQPEPASAARQPRVMDEPVQWQPEPEPLLPPPSQRRVEPRQESRQESRPEDPLAGIAAELSRVQAETSAPKPRSAREFARSARPERPRPAPAATPADEPSPATADQNLAEMAQRLEAALRRPKPAEPRAPESRTSAMLLPSIPDPMPTAAMTPTVELTAEPQENAPSAAANPSPARATPSTPGKPAGSKSVYDSLEQEMASLLGRPNNKT